MTSDRRKRHLKILELISTHALRTQEEVAELLAREGWEVTQSSVSRDISALRLVKVGGVYRVDLDFCKGCGICARECPCGAIRMVDEPT